jgi:hypothetical protein
MKNHLSVAVSELYARNKYKKCFDCTITVKIGEKIKINKIPLQGKSSPCRRLKDEKSLINEVRLCESH